MRVSCHTLLASAIVKEDVEQRRPDGLVELHAYTMIRCAEIAGVRLLQLRNLWGSDTIWNGAWSSGSEEWVKNTAVRQELGQPEATGSLFWISAEDFFLRFTKVYESPCDLRP